jgi:hypothetical protein
LVALLVAEEHWRGTRAWHDYKSEMEAKGERFDAARLIPPKVPDEENFAACPYLSHVSAKPPESPGWTNIDSFLPKSCSLPHRTGWPYGLSNDMINWAVAFQGAAASERIDPAQAAKIVLDHLKGCEPVLTELRAASLRRYCRFNVSYEDWGNMTESPGKNSTVLHFAMLKGLFQVLSLHAEAELAADKTDEALADINLMFRLDDGLKDEPLLISQLVRIACAAVVLQPIAEGLAERRWSDAQLHSLQERLGQIDLLTSAVRAFYGERDIYANPFFLSFGRSSPLNLLGWDRLEQLSFNRAFQESLLPRINLTGREVDPAIGHACDLAMSNYSLGPSSAIIHHCIFAAMMLPSAFHIPQKAAAVQTDVDLVTIACALERFHLKEDSYPEKLEALAPRFIATLPHDIINGQPLKYHRTANGKFVLYSVGWNEKDDGGVVATDKDGRQNRLQGDWVLEYPD